MGGRWSLEEAVGLGPRAIIWKSFQALYVLVCVIQKATKEPPETEFSRAFCGKSEKEINLFIFNLHI